MRDRYSAVKFLCTFAFVFVLVLVLVYSSP